MDGRSRHAVSRRAVRGSRHGRAMGVADRPSRIDLIRYRPSRTVPPCPGGGDGDR